MALGSNWEKDGMGRDQWGDFQGERCFGEVGVSSDVGESMFWDERDGV